MNTKDSETPKSVEGIQTEKAEIAVFWDEIAHYLPNSIERSVLGDEKIFNAFRMVYPKIKRHLLQQQIQEDIERMEKMEKDFEVQSDGQYHFLENQKVIGYNHALDTLITYKKDQLTK